MDWNPLCSIKCTCSYSYVRDNILQMISSSSSSSSNDGAGGSSTSIDRCLSDYDSSNDDDKSNIQRLCLFKELLYNNYTIDHITQLWVDAFVTENTNLLQCKCQRYKS